MIVALVGILTADFFISEQYGKQLWLMMGSGPALYGVARRTYPEEQEAAAAAAAPELRASAAAGAGRQVARRWGSPPS